MVSEQELSQHQEKTGGERITKEQLLGNIKSVDYIVHKESCLTLCIITLNNGFTVTGESACADPKMFDAAIGRRIAYEHAERKIWPLMGYALKEEMFQRSLVNYEDRLYREKQELEDRIYKLEMFINGTEQFRRMERDDQNLLRKQHVVMTQYNDILETRIQQLN